LAAFGALAGGLSEWPLSTGTLPTRAELCRSTDEKYKAHTRETRPPHIRTEEQKVRRQEQGRLRRMGAELPAEF
jgi:hypothetical protein